jgi:hypothetical protein
MVPKGIRQRRKIAFENVALQHAPNILQNRTLATSYKQ